MWALNFFLNNSKMENECSANNVEDLRSTEQTEQAPEYSQENGANLSEDDKRTISNSNDEDIKGTPNLTLDLSEIAEADSTIHAFDVSNVTVIEKLIESNDDVPLNPPIAKPTSCEGSDSGVEIVENCGPLERTISVNSTNSQEFVTVTPAGSYESSIISCCSNLEEAYNLLARRNSTLLEDYKLTCEGTSENGSESSSVVGCANSRTPKRPVSSSVKKKINSGENKNKSQPGTPRSSRSRPPATPKNIAAQIKTRGKSTEHKQIPKTPNNRQCTPVSDSKKSVKTKVLNNNLSLVIPKEPVKRNSISRASSTTRSTPITTPTDDGRWPSINSKPAPIMGRSMRGLSPNDLIPTVPSSKRAPSNVMVEKSTAIEKYGTLPRRAKPSTSSLSTIKKQDPRDTRSINKCLPPFPSPKIRFKPKTLIYHEIGSQTLLGHNDLEKALAGVTVNLASPHDTVKEDKSVQADYEAREIEKLQEQLKKLNENHEKLTEDYKKQSQALCDTELRLKEETTEKNGLKEELKQNTERVLAILGKDGDLPTDENSSSSDSLMVLESQYQKVSQIMIKQENEISDLNAYCRSLQRDLSKSVANVVLLQQQQRDLEMESAELQEFMQVEKTTLSDALRDSENETKNFKLILIQKEKELEEKQSETKRLMLLGEQRRQDNMVLQARLGNFELQSREMLIYQGGHISGATVALSSLISRLDGLVEELIVSYSISEQDLEDAVFHNEAYTNSSSSPDATPENYKRFLKEKSPSPKHGSSFVSAIINAIKNATAQAPFSNNSKDPSKDTLSLDNSDSTELLDSETEPCLMMEPVLEDVIIPDGHSHNMISSGHSIRLTHSESLNNLFQRQFTVDQTESLNASITSNTSSMADFGTNSPLVDQVIEVDNLITRLLKVLRLIQIEQDENMNELQDERDSFSQQVCNQKDANKVVVKQLKDWETLGAHLKREVSELMQQVGRKNNEIDDLKSELNQHRNEIERLNEDVCALSTACQKAELQLKEREEEVKEAAMKWETSGEMPSKEIIAQFLIDQKEVTALRDLLVEKDKQLDKIKQEFLDSRHVLLENWKDAVGETKRQYEAIDKALEILHNIQSVVQQCPPLAKLQRDLEETNFQSASTLPSPPSEFNTSDTLVLKPVNNIEIPSPINSTA